MTVWPVGRERESVVVRVGSGEAPLVFQEATDEVRWVCDGMVDAQRTAAAEASTVWSLRADASLKGDVLSCGVDSGRLKWNGWAPSANASVPFASGGDGYACDLRVRLVTRARASSSGPRPFAVL